MTEQMHTADQAGTALRFNRPTHVVVRLRRLRRLPVIELSARRLGNVEAIYLDARACRLALIEVSGGLGNPSERISGARIRRVGSHAVMLTGKEHSGLPSLPEDDEWVESENIIGMEVIDTGGDRIGFINDVYVNRDTLAIEAYELETPWFENRFRGPRLIMPGQVHSCGQDLMIAVSRGKTAADQPVATITPERSFRVGWEERTLRVPLVQQQEAADQVDVPTAKSA